MRAKLRSRFFFAQKVMISPRFVFNAFFFNAYRSIKNKQTFYGNVFNEIFQTDGHRE